MSNRTDGDGNNVKEQHSHRTHNVTITRQQNIIFMQSTVESSNVSITEHDTNNVTEEKHGRT